MTLTLGTMRQRWYYSFLNDIIHDSDLNTYLQQQISSALRRRNGWRWLHIQNTISRHSFINSDQNKVDSLIHRNCWFKTINILQSCHLSGIWSWKNSRQPLLLAKSYCKNNRLSREVYFLIMWDNEATMRRWKSIFINQAFL